MKNMKLALLAVPFIAGSAFADTAVINDTDMYVKVVSALGAQDQMETIAPNESAVVDHDRFTVIIGTNQQGTAGRVFCLTNIYEGNLVGDELPGRQEFYVQPKVSVSQLLKGQWDNLADFIDVQDGDCQRGGGCASCPSCPGCPR